VSENVIEDFFSLCNANDDDFLFLFGGLYFGSFWEMQSSSVLSQSLSLSELTWERLDGLKDETSETISDSPDCN